LGREYVLVLFFCQIGENNGRALVRYLGVARFERLTQISLCQTAVA
jgi:hypothetical protein